MIYIYTLHQRKKQRKKVFWYILIFFKHRKAFIFSRKQLSKNGAQKISSLCPFNMSEAGMCILKKKTTEYSVSEIVFLVLISNEGYSTIKICSSFKLYYIVYREFHVFIYLFWV